MQYEEIEWVVGEGGDWGVFGLGGDLFKLCSRASNGNDYSTLLFATTPAQ